MPVWTAAFSDCSSNLNKPFSIPLASAAWCSSHMQIYGNCDTQSHGKKPTLIAQCQACDFNKSYEKLIFPNFWYGSVASVSNGLALGYSSKLNKTSKSINFQVQRLPSLWLLMFIGCWAFIEEILARTYVFLQEMREMQRNIWCSNSSEKSQFKKNHYKGENKATAAMKLLAP